MKFHWIKLTPYVIVLAFCFINVGIIGPNKENRSVIPFFNWCLFCSSDNAQTEYYEIHIKEKNNSVLWLNSRNNRSQFKSQLVKEIIQLHNQSKLTKEVLREKLARKNTTVTLAQIRCDVHQWFIKNECEPKMILGTYEI